MYDIVFINVLKWIKFYLIFDFLRVIILLEGNFKILYVFRDVDICKIIRKKV